MASTKNDICLKLWTLYSTIEPPAKDVLRGNFAQELFHGWRLESNERLATAACQTVNLTGLQSLVLKKNGKLRDRVRIEYPKAADAAVLSMAASDIESVALNFGEKEALAVVKRTDGIDTFTMLGKVMTDLRVDDIAWVLEPFVLVGDKSGKTWAEMTKDEQAEANKASMTRNASQMPKYMQKRRVKIDDMVINHDGREAWIEITMLEIEPFAKEESEANEVMRELGLSEAQAAEAEASTESSPEAKQDTQSEQSKGELAEREAEDKPHHDSAGVSTDELDEFSTEVDPLDMVNAASIADDDLPI